MIQVEHIDPIAVAKGISDYGFMAVTAAFFLVIAGGMLWMFSRWFMKTVNNITDNQQKSLNSLMTTQHELLRMIRDIREYSESKSLEQIHIISGISFDNAKFIIYRNLLKIKEENHLDDNEDIIERKIKLIVENIHNDRNSKFDSFSYFGIKLSEYTNPAWVQRIVALMVAELYACDGFNDKRAINNIDLAYQSFKVEFYKNLTKK
jgi:hypothetical protein